MLHNDIVQLVNSMKVVELTMDNFEEFAQNAHGLFEPKGSMFEEFYSPGLNDSSARKYDFSKGKPAYRMGNILLFERIEPRELLAEGKKWINVIFDKNYEVWGIRPSELPLKFGFDPGKALYVAEQVGNGTPEQPWETLYLKLG